MVSKGFYLRFISRVIFISLSAFVLAFFLIRGQYIYGVLALIILVFQAISLVKYLNYTNKKITLFFEALKNEDFTLSFSENLDLKSLGGLNKSLNELNETVQEIHLKKQSQEQYYQQILKQADIGILTYDDKGHILFANPTVEKLLNYTPLTHIKQLMQVDEKLYQTFTMLEPFERKLFQLVNEREKTELALTAKPIKQDDKTLLLVVVQDIYKELDEKETDSWERLIRVLTHEIMNTIAPITSISEAILKYYKKGDDVMSLEEFDTTHIQNTARGLEVIKEQGTNLMSFVQSYRSFLSVPNPDKTLVPAARILNKAKIIMDHDLEGHQMSIIVSCAPLDLDLFIDEKQILQVLINLIKNALESLKHTDGGEIRISAFVNNEGQKCIEVWDNGPGISVELINDIFIPFFTTKKTGTGIGLSLSKQVLRLHGGNLQVRSVPEKETSFMLFF